MSLFGAIGQLVFGGQQRGAARAGADLRFASSQLDASFNFLKNDRAELKRTSDSLMALSQIRLRAGAQGIGGSYAGSVAAGNLHRQYRQSRIDYDIGNLAVRANLTAAGAEYAISKYRINLHRTQQFADIFNDTLSKATLASEGGSKPSSPLVDIFGGSYFEDFLKGYMGGGRLNNNLLR